MRLRDLRVFYFLFIPALSIGNESAALNFLFIFILSKSPWIAKLFDSFVVSLFFAGKWFDYFLWALTVLVVVHTSFLFSFILFICPFWYNFAKVQPRFAVTFFLLLVLLFGFCLAFWMAFLPFGKTANWLLFCVFFLTLLYQHSLSPFLCLLRK